MITKQEIKGQMKGFFIAVASWFIVTDLRDYIIKVSPVENTFLIGVAILAIILFID